LEFELSITRNTTGKYKGVSAVKVWKPSPSSPSSPDQNQAQKEDQNGEDTKYSEDTISHQTDEPSGHQENRAQNEAGDDSEGSEDTLRTLMDPHYSSLATSQDLQPTPKTEAEIESAIKEGEIRPMTTQEALASLGWFETEKDVKRQYAAFIENFFSNTTPLQPVHLSLDESPCELIIGDTGKLYYCKIHPKIKSPHLEVIEQHCKYKEPEKHKAEILRKINDE
jgi:hypothetical protein